MPTTKVLGLLDFWGCFCCEKFWQL